MKNENRSGYKKTKVGWIPEEWEISSFGAEFEIQLGKMLNKKASEGNDPQPYLANANVRWGTFNLSDLREMSFSQKEREKFVLKKGDLLVCEGGEIGRCAIWEEEIKPCYFQKALHRLRPTSDEINSQFSMWFLHVAFSSARIKGLIGITSIAHFTRETFLSFPISKPPVKEQEAIAEVLECWDAGIRSMEKKIELKLQLKKGLMQKLLSGQSRLAGFSEDWKTVTLEGIGSFSKGKGISKNETLPKGIPCIRYGEIYTIHHFVLKRFQSFISKESAALAQQIKPNDLLFAGSGETIEDIGKAVAYLKSDIAFAGGDIVVFSPKKTDARSDFLSYFINTIGRKKLNALGQGQSVVHIYAKDLKTLKIKLPPLDEQKSITEILSDADVEISTLEEKLACWKDQKKYLLNELVTGSIRVGAA